MLLCSALAVVSVSCSSESEDPPLPSIAAEAFAEAFDAGSFDEIAFTDGTSGTEVTTMFQTAMFGMGEARPSADVGGMIFDEQEGMQATALLDVVWTFDEDVEWVYETEFTLLLVEGQDDEPDEWRVEWSPAIIEPTLGSNETLVRDRLVPERGTILGPDGQPFIVERPEGDLAREVIGVAGEATAEQIEQSGGRLEIGDVTGRSGLERSADDVLAGRLGVVVSSMDLEADVEPREVFRVEAVDGDDLLISLDESMQLAAQAALADIGPPSALVAIRPSTSQVLAVASGPGSNGLSTATLGQYAPGSTFKVITSLAALRAGSTPESTVECPATITVDGRDFKNYGDYPASGVGTITLRTALANSCNTAMIGLGDVVSQDDLAEAAEALGLGIVAPLGVPYFEGVVPRDATAVQHAASMIGQDRILVSPLTMASVAASVAAGETILPTLVEPRGGTERPTAGRPVTAEEALLLRSMMEAVVTEGSGRLLADLPGPPAAAKTGTAEYGTATPPRTHAWMIAVQGDLAVSAFVEDGPGGSTTAGPILEAFLRTVG